MTANVRLQVSVVGLFVSKNDVLLLHQMTLPEPDCWDLPGGRLDPSEDLISGLRREVKEETGLTEFQVEQLLTVVETFYREKENQRLHKLDIVYLCRVEPKPSRFEPLDTEEVGPKGIRWIAAADLASEHCSRRAWQAMQTAGLLPEDD